MKSAILIFIICTYVIAFTQQQAPISFRSQALGGVIKDDLDLIYDPVELRFVKGLRFYTNLSNLTSGQEQFLNDISDNEFLFGTSFKFPFKFNLWASFLIRFQDTQLSNDIAIDSNLDGIYDIFEEGRFYNIYTSFLDTNGDGLYDIKNIISQDKVNYAKSKHHAYIFNTATFISNWTIGLKFMTTKQRIQNTVASFPLGTGFGQLIGTLTGDPSFSLNNNRTLIRFDFNDFNWIENGNFANDNEEALTSFKLGLMRHLVIPVTDSVEIRADFGLNREKQNLNINDVYQGSTEYYERRINNFQDSYREMESIFNQTDINGNRWLAAISVKKVFQKEAERKNDGYWRFGLGIEYANFDFYSDDRRASQVREFYYDGDDTLAVDFSDDRESVYVNSDAGDLTSIHYSINALVNFHLGPSIYVGAGIFYHYTSRDRPTILQDSYNNYRNYERFGGSGLEDFQRWEESLSTANHKIEQYISNFSFPVGIEYILTKNGKWSIRFGSIFNYIKTSENEIKEVTKSEPLKITTIDGLGNEFVDIDDNIFQSSSGNKKFSESNTSYYYGLGFNPNNHFQIDLLGFLGNEQNLQLFDVEFLRSLRISFTVKL